jgi:hypothetical protein
MITAAQEERLSEANSRTGKKKQDRDNPMVINIEDGRLMPNTPRLRAHKQYRVYSGPLDASVPQRMKWLEGALKQLPRRVVNSAPEEVFDIGTATADDLVVFAMENYGATLDPAHPLKKLRTEVAKLAAAAESDDALN